MKYAVLVFNIVVFYYCFFVIKKRFAPLVFFSSLWFSLATCSALRLYGLYEISNQMWTYVLLGEISFLLPSLYPHLDFKVGNRISRYQNLQTTSVNFSLLNAALIFLSLISIYEIFGAVRQYLSGMDMGQVRAAYYGYGENASNTKLTTILHTYLTEPLRVVLRPIVLIDFFLISKHKGRFFLELFIIASGIVISGGRFELVYFAIQYITVSFFFLKAKKDNNDIRRRDIRKRKRGIIFTLLTVFAVIYYIGRARGSFDIIRTIYLSLAEPLVNCDYRIINLQKTEVGFFFGLVSFRGILNPLFFILKQLHIMSYPAVYLLAGDYMNTQNYVSVGVNLKTNAYVTPLYDFFLDGGLLGIILGMFFFGVLAKRTFFVFSKNNASRKVDVRSAVIYLIIVNSIIQMLHTLAWADTSYTFAILFCCLLTRKQKS